MYRLHRGSGDQRKMFFRAVYGPNRRNFATACHNRLEPLNADR